MKNKSRKQLLISLLVILLITDLVLGLYFYLSKGRPNTGADPSQVQKTEVTDESITDTDSGSDDALLATVFCASDYQNERGWDFPADTLTKLIEEVKDDGKEPDMVIMCGDYSNDRKLHNYEIDPDPAIEEIKTVATSELPEITGEDVIFVQGNHDKMTDSIAESGLHEYDDYLVYVLNTQNDFPWKQGKTAGCLDKVTRASEEMKTCFDKLISKGETRPVFIAGHVPLHFTARTSSRHTTGDNLYSSLIFDVVNEAGKSLDIVYLFGHNHSKGWDCYLGGSSVFLKQGDSILIPEFDKSQIFSDVYKEQTLNFTYLNAGYTGYYMNCGPAELDNGMRDSYAAADETLTGTVFEIYGDRIVITRYDADGVHELGHEGKGDPYMGNVDSGLIDESSYSERVDSPQTVSRKK